MKGIKGGSLPKKLLSRREKSNHSRDKSSDKHRPLSAETFFALFKPDAAKRKDEEEKGAGQEENADAAKVEQVNKRLPDHGLENVTEDHVVYALRSKFAAGDVDKAIELITLQKSSLAGKIQPYNPSVQMLGAENRGNVTCYLDALLFAMFAKLEAFECMLSNDLPDEPQRNLAALLRLWINMLRSGKLIQTDMTQHIQDALAACGWRDAQLLEQQDTSEAFAFITETLQLPLLTLQVDLFHHGKTDDADHKVVYERLLNLAVPADPDGKGIQLEDCLEEYFNSRVDVLRDSLDDKKGGSRQARTPSPEVPLTNGKNNLGKTVSLVDHTNGETVASTESAPPERRHSSEAPGSRPSTSQLSVAPLRSRTETIIQRVVLPGSDVDADDKPSESNVGLFERARRKASIVKAITIPAWQFFKLIPWHSPAANKEPQSDLEVARHFSQRPVVGICLKRYLMNSGVPKRHNTFIDIPDSLRLPHFIVDERHVQENGLTTDYKLVLQSVVCHRGESLHSGHYISFCRVAPKLLTDNRRCESDPPPDYEEAQWMRFDDLALDDRVTPVDDIKQSLKDEMPYLLFYQIVPIVDVTASSTDGTDAGLPSYDDAKILIRDPENSAPGRDKPTLSRQTSSYFENRSSMPSTNVSVRFSSDQERCPRRSTGDDDNLISVSRRGSVVYYDGRATPTSAATPLDSHSLVNIPGDETNETTAQRLSRAAAKFKGNGKSRPQSQMGEGRMSATMSRLSGLVRTSKEPLRETAHTDNEDETGTIYRRTRPKARLDKGKEREAKAKPGDVPDRECSVM